MEYFGMKLKLARVAKGYSREKFGDILHLSASAIQHYEEGTRFPNLGLFYDIANLLEEPLDYFLNDNYSRFEDVELQKAKNYLSKEEEGELIEFEHRFCTAKTQRDKTVAILDLLAQFNK